MYWASRRVKERRSDDWKARAEHYSKLVEERQYSSTMTATISRPPLSDRLTTGKVIAVLRASHVSVLGPVCDVLVQWLAAGPTAVSIGPLLGDSLRGGNPSAHRDRCRAGRAVIDQTVLS